MDYKKSVSIVIPNYNGKHLLSEYLPDTFKAISKSGVNFEIIVVDDFSTDDSIAFIKDFYPEIKLIVNSENSGFSYSCNKGIEAATCELILLLNSDVKLTEDYFDELFKYFSDTETFGVMGRIIDMEGDNIQDAARVPKFNGFKIKTEFYYTLNPDDRNYSFYLSGANALIDAKKLKEIGGFNELFSPFYGEDLELSIRAWRLGWKCYYEHQAICRHQTSSSTSNYKTPEWVKSVYYRNRFYVHAIHLNRLPLILWFIQITVIDMLPKLLFGNLEIWKSYKAFFTNLDLVRNERRKIKNLMKKKHSKMSLRDISTKILKSLNNKSVVRL